MADGDDDRQDDDQEHDVPRLLAEADAASRAGDLGDAYRLLTQARDRSVGDAAALAAVEVELGRVAAAFGDPEEARSQFDSALGRFTAEEDERGQAEAQYEIGRLDAAIGATDVAKSRFRRSSDLAKRNDLLDLVARCQLELAAVGVALGDLRIAQLHHGAALAAPLAAADQVFQADGALVEAELAVRSAERDHALTALTRALEVLPEDDHRRDALRAVLEQAADGSDLPPALRRPRRDGEMSVAETVFTMVGLDSNGDLDAATTVPPTPGPEAIELGQAAVEGILDRRQVRLADHPGSELYLETAKSAHGLAFALLLQGDLIYALAVLAAGVDPDEERVLRDVEPVLAGIAGRWRTGTTIGFGRHLLVRQGALSTIAERPIAFVRWVGPSDDPLVEDWLEILTGVAQAWFSMIAADGPGAQRLRATRIPLPDVVDPDLPEW